jgi:hypothetical protein
LFVACCWRSRRIVSFCSLAHSCGPRFDFDGLWLVLRECGSDCPSRLDDSACGIACGPRRIRKAVLSVGVRHVSTLSLGDECIRRSDEIWLNHLAVALSQVFQSIGEA